MARTWKCDGVPKNGTQYPFQNPPGKHEPYENYGCDCIICGLPKEAMTDNRKKVNTAIVVGKFFLTLGVLLATVTVIASIFRVEKRTVKDSLPIPTNSNTLNNSSTFSESYALPLDDKSQPLPHNGLFVRRNNQYGSSSDAGLKSSIEQGILIDQRSIRFDDFSTFDTAQEVSLPKDGQSMAVNYGIAEIPDAAKVNNASTHYLAIALRTANEVPRNYSGSEAPSVNYIFVADTSGSMEGEKLDAAKASIRELFSNLRDDDVIGIIEFDDQPKTALKATPKSRLEISQFSQLLGNLIPDGGTDINLGLLFGIDEITRSRDSYNLNHIFLFSDGNPTSGETDWLDIRQNINSKTQGKVRLSTFAFGSDANIRELDALAGLSGGKYTFVIDPQDVKDSLKDELTRREYLAGINVQLKVEIDPSIQIMHFYGHDQVTDRATRAAVLQDVEAAKERAEEETGVASEPDIITDEEGIRVFVPDLAIGETYWLVFELAIPDGKIQKSAGQLTVQYVDTFKRENFREELNLFPGGNIATNVVVQQALSLLSSEVAFYALDDLYQEDLDIAQQRIQNHVATLSATNGLLESDAIADDVVTFNKFLSLASNLGQQRITTDVNAPEVRGATIFSLNEFGRVRNGFVRAEFVKHSPSP